MNEEILQRILADSLQFLDKVFGLSEMDDPDFAERARSLHNALTRQQDALNSGSPPNTQTLGLFFSENGVLQRLATELQCEEDLTEAISLFQSHN